MQQADRLSITIHMEEKEEEEDRSMILSLSVCLCMSIRNDLTGAYASVYLLAA